MQRDEPDQPSADETTVAGPQAAAAVTPHEPSTIAPHILDDAQTALLTAVLNRIIPEGSDIPGAGDLGVATTIEKVLAAYPALRRLFADGLTAIDIASSRQFARAFVALGDDQQDTVLEATERAFTSFFAALVDHTYRGYYTHPRVYAAIGYAHRPPQPLGHELPLFDPAMLERQRQRAPFWRPITS